MTDQIDECFAAALREVLVEKVTSAPVRERWLARQRRRLTVGGGILVVAVGGGGIAYGTGVFTTAIPGGTVTTPEGAAHAYTETGTQTLDLGPRPRSANGVSISLYCLTPGTFVYPGGASESCNTAEDVRDAPKTNAPYSVPLGLNQRTITIKAAPGARWRMTARYVTLTNTSWGVNASGQTYGMQNHHGTPDLVAVIATNHRVGYSYAKALNGPTPTTRAQALAQNGQPRKPIPVYESDGETQIGIFKFG